MIHEKKLWPYKTLGNQWQPLCLINCLIFAASDTYKADIKKLIT